MASLSERSLCPYGRSPSGMTVLHVNENLSLDGGVETYLFSLIPRLDQREISSVVAYGRGDPDVYGPAHRVPEITKAGFQHQRAARRHMGATLKTVQPDLIHIHNVQNVGIVKACLDHGPTVLTTHDHRWACPANTFYYKRTREVCNRTCGLGCFTTTVTKHCLTPRPQYALYFYYRVKWGLRHADRFAHIVSPSRATKDRHVKGGMPSDQITPLPYFCSLEPRDEPRALPDPPVITYIGRVADNKGCEFFVEALGLLPDSVQGRVVGAGAEDDKATVRNWADEHGCADRLAVQGWADRAEIPEILDRTSVLVFPSLCVETLGIVGLEALSRGVPAVASDVGGVREGCHDGETGFVVPPKDAAAIADRTQRLLSDHERLRAFGHRGLEVIRERFTPEWHVDRLLNIYEQVCSAASSSLSAHA